MKRPPLQVPYAVLVRSIVLPHPLRLTAGIVNAVIDNARYLQILALPRMVL